ncbi:MAG: AraC family transcriptional regulator [Clostridia bacterium]|nr:AraC family transcriptional regulator [Clostridia bacterium]
MISCEYRLSDNSMPIIKCFRSVVSPEKREYREHHHTECELSVFLAGSGIYTVGDIRYPFKRGDVFLFGSDEVHCITEISEGIELLNIHFEPRILWESVELFRLFSSRRAGCNRLEDEALEEMLLSCESELRERPLCYEIGVKCTLLSTLLYIIRNCQCVDTELSVSLEPSHVATMKKALDYINASLDKPITLKTLADMAYMSQPYFSTLFKKYNGINLSEYITIKRVERAIELLKSTRMTKLEIAEACGFNSSSNFYKAFYSVTGKTPREYSN